MRWSEEKKVLLLASACRLAATGSGVVTAALRQPAGKFAQVVAEKRRNAASRLFEPVCAHR
jgi:hypothetical protein